jgi:hypothetical protein
MFIIPKLDYWMMSSVVNKGELNKIGIYRGEMMNNMVWWPKLSKDLFTFHGNTANSKLNVSQKDMHRAISRI